MKKIIGFLLCSVCLCTCTEDPVFEKEELALTVTEYIDNVSYYSADVYCQIEANVSINEVLLQYHTTRDWDKAQEIKMASSSSYPELAEFTKNLKVYHGHITDIKEDTTYYCRIVTVTPGGKIVVKDSLQFTTLSLLASAVTTKEATSVSYTSATLNGEVTSAENASVTQTGFYYSLNADMSSAEKVVVSSNAGYFSKYISDLEHNKTYYFQAYAVINGKICKGKMLHFITNEYTLAEVETGDAEALYFSAKCTLNIIGSGNSTITEEGIIYGTNSELEGNDIMKVSVSSYSNYAQLDNLKDAHYYYYRAYATNSAGIAYGQIKKFATKWAKIDIDLEVAEESYNSANISLTIESLGFDVREYGISYQADGSTSTSQKSTSVSGWKDKEMTKTTTYYLSGLKQGTEYEFSVYYKYVDNDGKMVTETERWGYFETLGYEVPTVTTNDATNIYTTSAKITVTASANGASITGRGIYYTSKSNYYLYDDEDDFETYTDIWTKKTGSSITLTNLSPNTTYYYIAYATSSVGTGYGYMNFFTTPRATYPSVTTEILSNSTSSVKLGGSTDGGGDQKVTVGFVYSTSYSPTIENATNVVVSTSFTPTTTNYGDFTKTLYFSSGNFERGKFYYVRAYCTNSYGTSYGNTEYFEF